MIADKAYLALRNKLNCLHYCQPLSKDSCALAERLLGDLLATTELYHITKQRADVAEGQVKKEQIALVPLQKENARLVKENNGLHKEIITSKENLSMNDYTWKHQVQQLESEYNDIKQAYLQKDYKIKELEKRNLKLEERLNKVLTSSFTPAAVAVQRFSMEPAANQEMNERILEDLHRETNREVKSEDEESLINQMCAADERVQIMTKELSIYKEYKTEAEDRIKELEGMIHERDREIDRLNNIYMTTENMDKMNLEFTQQANSDTIAKLNSQLDYINKENNRLHKVIADLKIKNKGNTGMYLENRKVCDQIEKLKTENNDLRRRCEKDETEITTLKERETSLIETLKTGYVEREKYESSLQTIQYQQQDIEKFKKYFEIKQNQKKLQVFKDIASEPELDYEPEKQEQKVSIADFSKIKNDKDRLAKKVEQFRNEINAISGKYLGAQRRYDQLTGEYQELQEKYNNLEASHESVKERLQIQDRLIQQLPINNKENMNGKLNWLFLEYNEL